MLPRKWLAALFVVSLLVFSVALAPASLVAARLDGVRIGGGALEVGTAYGRWWRGQATWQWRSLGGNLAWTVEWRGLTPGIDVVFNGAARGRGWIGGIDALQVRDADIILDARAVSEVVASLTFDGTVSARGLSFTLAGDRVADAAGVLTYGGGTASWGDATPVTVPPLRGNIESTEGGARLAITSPEIADVLAQASVEGNMGRLTVYRAWPAALGISRGGDPGDAVFETSLPLWRQ